MNVISFRPKLKSQIRLIFLSIAPVTVRFVDLSSHFIFLFPLDILNHNFSTTLSLKERDSV